MRRVMEKSAQSLVAVCQMTCTHDIGANLETGKSLIERAVRRGSKLICLPECFDFIGRNRAETNDLCQSSCDKILSDYCSLAKQHNVWLSLGGQHQKNPSDSNGKLLNSHFVVNDSGEIVARYNKLHLFDVDIPGKVRLMESEFSTAGKSMPAPVETSVGKLGLATCYDLRFPEYSCWLRENGAQLIAYPSAFTLNTGLAHWETLLRARAIETQCYVLAAAQTGRHNEKRVSYGHAMIVDPWGTVVAQCKDEQDVCVAEIDLDYLAAVKERIPCQGHRRRDMYHICATGRGRSEPDNEKYSFGEHSISSACVFYQTDLSYAFVNRKPVLVGHVLVTPLRVAKRLTDLTAHEISDLFNTVAKVQRMLESYHGVSSSTVSVQDGPDAGQSVDHVHVHILPRRPGDFKSDDQVYVELEQHDKGEIDVSKFRTVEDMGKEASSYRSLLKHK